MDFISPFVDFLRTCDSISSNKLFLNCVQNSERNIKQLVTSQIDRSQDVEYVDGSVRHKLIFTLFDFKSISFNALIHELSASEKNENIETLLEVQDLIEWIAEQDKAKNYPDFGENYEVEKLECAYLSPSTPTFDNNIPEIAKYSIPIVCYLMDYTEAI